MELLLILMMVLFNESHLLNDLPAMNTGVGISEAEIATTEFARVYSNSLPSEAGGTSRRLLHTFDCSVPKWKKAASISACEISKDVELVFYEFKNYNGDHLVISHKNNGNFLELPKKFASPGSIEVLYKGNRNCISSVNQNSENAKDYLSVVNQLAGGLNDMPYDVPYRIYIVNRHPSKAISVRYKLNGRSQSISTVKVGPDEKKYIINYVLERPKNLIILKAEFLNE